MERRQPILVIDDNAETTAALSAVLELRGYEAISARDGLDALSQLRGGIRPRFIVLDWLMPNLDGRGFLERAAADPELGSIPIIVYSALGSRVLARDVAAIVSKAEDPDVLLDVVARLAERGS
jgi:two-component system response regulator MprA